METLPRSEVDEASRPFGTEEVREDPLRNVRIVEEQDQVAKADERVGAVTCSCQCRHIPVNITDDMQTHDAQSADCGREPRAPRGPTALELILERIHVPLPMLSMLLAKALPPTLPRSCWMRCRHIGS